ALLALRALATIRSETPRLRARRRRRDLRPRSSAPPTPAPDPGRARPAPAGGRSPHPTGASASARTRRAPAAHLARLRRAAPGWCRREALLPAAATPYCPRRAEGGACPPGPARLAPRRRGHGSPRNAK